MNKPHTLEQLTQDLVSSIFTLTDEPEYALERAKRYRPEAWQHIVNVAYFEMRRDFGVVVNSSLKAVAVAESEFIRIYAEKLLRRQWQVERTTQSRHKTRYEVFIIEKRDGWIEFRLCDPYLPDDIQKRWVTGGTLDDHPRFIQWAHEQARQLSGRIVFLHKPVVIW